MTRRKRCHLKLFLKKYLKVFKKRLQTCFQLFLNYYPQNCLNYLFYSFVQNKVTNYLETVVMNCRQHGQVIKRDRHGFGSKITHAIFLFLCERQFTALFMLGGFSKQFKIFVMSRRKHTQKKIQLDTELQLSQVQPVQCTGSSNRRGP